MTLTTVTEAALSKTITRPMPMAASALRMLLNEDL